MYCHWCFSLFFLSLFCFPSKLEQKQPTETKTKRKTKWWDESFSSLGSTEHTHTPQYYLFFSRRVFFFNYEISVADKVHLKKWKGHFFVTEEEWNKDTVHKDRGSDSLSSFFGFSSASCTDKCFAPDVSPLAVSRHIYSVTPCFCLGTLSFMYSIYVISFSFFLPLSDACFSSVVTN